MGSKKNGRLISNDDHWVVRAVKAGLLTFVLAMCVGLPAQRVVETFSPAVSVPMLILIILAGVVSDIVGVSSAAADEVPFHAMAAKKIPGAKQSLKLIRNADKVSSVMNDVIGDLSSSISGGLTAALVFSISASYTNLDEETVGALAVSLVAGLTVGGKAAGKKIALRHANNIMRICGRVLYTIEKATGLNLLGTGKGGQRKNGR